MLTITDYTPLSAVRIAAAVQAGELSALEVVDAALACVEERDVTVRAFREIWPGQARERAAEIDARVRQGDQLPLAGVPLGIKATEGLNAFQSERLIAAGCVPIGTTSVPHRGSGWQTYGHTDRGPTTNPLNPARSPGGSSAGSAAAVAAGMVPLATGSDGAGSARIPAAWCAILGLKPTNGAFPARDRAGLNTPGPLARHAHDAAAYLHALAGHQDTAPPVPWSPCTVAWSPTLGFADTTPEIATTARAALERLTDAGLLMLTDTTVLLNDPAPAWSSLRSTQHDHHSDITELISGNDRHLQELFDQVDILATPTTPHPPHGHDGPGRRMSVALTWAFNISGHPRHHHPRRSHPQRRTRRPSAHHPPRRRTATAPPRHGSEGRGQYRTAGRRQRLTGSPHGGAGGRKSFD
ncbi:amidase family protein [Streptomyces griseocarneus]|uniref:amidase family protein n=1 Tax=Streptomyces griseocarneus TaxID=51201 RepID=UPI001982D28E|nr:amidase [Streptomyces griseocarneus]GHG63140.1 hypothetical protein GCM10018779_32440 [Streptomyces griseocarneus]